MAADFSWTPPLVVLALGAVSGAAVVISRTRRKAGSAPEKGGAPRVDLQRRYDALIRRLSEGAPAEERASLEKEAALILREMETGRTPEPVTDLQGGSEPAAAAAAATPAQAPAPASAWVGFAYGVLSMTILGGLIFLASQGSTQRQEGGSPTGGNPMSAPAGEGPQVSAEEEAQLKALEDAVRREPAQIGPRIELTRAYLHRRDLMQVFDQTKAILEIEPGNPHALTYQALVRVAMGQANQAETMLEEVIAKNPKIEDAYIHLAIARLQLGDRKGALEAIQAGQAQFPEDKEELARVFEQIADSAAGQGDEVPADHPEVAPPAMGTKAPSSSGSQVVVVVDLPKGVTVPEEAVLFVIVREAGLETGPPAAVKRIPARSFPITVTVTDKDSMAGEGIPGLVRIDARIDRDGDPLTKDPRDPVASEDNVRPGPGQILMVLTPGQG